MMLGLGVTALPGSASCDSYTEQGDCITCPMGRWMYNWFGVSNPNSFCFGASPPPAPKLEPGWSAGLVDSSGNPVPNPSSQIIANEQQSLVNQAAAIPCPFGSDLNGYCCEEGQIIDANGNCAYPSGASWTTWLFLGAVGVGAVMLLGQMKGRS